MKKNRILWAFLAILLVGSLVLGACKPKATEEPTKPPAEGEPTEPMEEEEPIKVGLVTDVGEVDDKSFNQSAWEGVQKAKEELDLGEIDYIETKDAKDYMANIDLFAKNDFDVIVTVGFALGEATLEAADKYPDVYFIGVDQFQAEAKDNVVGLIFEEDKSGFMAGALAGLLTETDTVAAVLGTDLVPPVVAFKEGYESGVAYVNPDAKVLSTYHPGGLDVAFTDPEWGATTAKQAIDNGADIVFGAGGKTGNGALIEAAGYEDVYCIGVDSDQWYTVPEAHPCLVSSAMKLITPGVVDIIEMYTKGNAPTGNYVGDVALAPFHDFEDEITQDIKDQLAEIREPLLAGEIDTGYAPGAAEEEEEEAAIDCMGAQEGDTVSMLYQWSGVEEENIMAILKPVVDACGIELEPESTRDQALLDTRVQAGTPPDIAFWNVTQLEQYQDILVPLADLGVHEDNYVDFWKNIGTVGGTWLGLPVKADPKTLIWYSPTNFDAFGYEVPETWDELNALVEQMVADGNVPWSMGFESGDATGWTGTDFVQDILLVKQGPEYINGILDGSIPYNDEGVKEAWQIYGNWAMDPKYTVGGAQGTLSTGFNDAILKVFSDPPEAMMVKQSGFAGGTITDQYPDLEYGTGYDFFGVPGAQGLQGGSDWMMMFSDKPAVKAIVAYLSSDAGGEKWAEVGFDLTPNSAGSGSYTNEALQKKADILTNASGFVPDIGDSIPGGFGSAEFSAISDFVNGAELDPLLDNLTEIQQEALGE